MEQLRAVQVASRMGVSLPTLYRMIRLGRFPKGDKISERIVVWSALTVDTWIAEKRREHAEQVRRMAPSTPSK